MYVQKSATVFLIVNPFTRVNVFFLHNKKYIPYMHRDVGQLKRIQINLPTVGNYKIINAKIESISETPTEAGTKMILQ
jgi:penicillin-binding protein-related factor A (putative recombinase)